MQPKTPKWAFLAFSRPQNFCGLEKGEKRGKGAYGEVLTKILFS
jgi:hypothetical protein